MTTTFSKASYSSPYSLPSYIIPSHRDIYAESAALFCTIVLKQKMAFWVIGLKSGELDRNLRSTVSGKSIYDCQSSHPGCRSSSKNRWKGSSEGRFRNQDPSRSITKQHIEQWKTQSTQFSINHGSQEKWGDSSSEQIVEAYTVQYSKGPDRRSSVKCGWLVTRF